MKFYTCYQHARTKAGRPIANTTGRLSNSSFSTPLRQLLMRIYITAFIIGLAFLNVSAGVYAQRITLKAKDAPLETVFEQIKKQTGYFFWYEDRMLDNTSKVTVNLKDADLKTALDACFKNQPLEYSIKEKMVVVKPKAKPQKNPTDNHSSQTDVSGKVVDENGEPLSGASVKVKGSALTTTTDNEGKFRIPNAPDNAVLIISYIGFESKEITATSSITIVLKRGTSALEEVQIVNTGYQQLPKERATGSFVQINNALLNRRVSTNLLDRLEGVTNGLLFNRNNSSEATISIRGQSTIYANNNPLIVLDGFPYDGSLSSINPNDIETITVLKDASAASIWGVRSGNGVIVITSKRASINQPLRFEMNSNVTIGEKPNINYMPFLKSESFIEMEKVLFARGFYNADINNTASRPALSPAVETLLDLRNGKITSDEAQSILDGLKRSDVRHDFEKFFLGSSVNQQYSLNAQGTSATARYFFSAGYDNNSSSFIKNGNDRLTLRSETILTPIKNLDITTGVMYASSNSTNNNSGLQVFNSAGKKLYPYAKLADDANNATTVSYGYRSSFKQDAENKGLLSWQYKPLDELNAANNVSNEIYLRFNARVGYQIHPDLKAEVLYQFEKSKFNNKQTYTQDTYFTRDLINKFTSTDINGNLVRPVPLGGILDNGMSSLNSQTGRFQLNYNHDWEEGKHSIAAIAGTEVKQSSTFSDIYRLYGYEENSISSKPVDYATSYRQYYSSSGAAALIPNRTLILGDGINRFRSIFSNAAYTLKHRYTLSASARMDESNLFGVSANQRKVPLWSAGLSWNIAEEEFIKNSWIGLLRLRSTYGFNGNVDKSVTAYTTARRSTDSFTRLPSATIINPPNPFLSWEKIGIFNIGVDLEVFNFLSGSIEWYHKKGTNLFGFRELDETSGLSQFKGNVASMRGSGVDIQLKSKNLKGKVEWTTDMLFSHTTDKVTSLDFGKISAASIVQQQATFANTTFGVVPLVGGPVYGIYSYKSAGLDPSTGAPRGYVNSVPSMDYAALVNGTPTNELVLAGTARPTYFGGFRNTVNWKGFSISANITYKLGYKFRRNSVNYDNLFRNWEGNSDFELRWQNPGDEVHTTVPSMPTGINANRSFFYMYSDDLISDASHIRLQDITLSYELGNFNGRIPVKTLSIYAYANNIGIIWKANKYGIDPDYIPSSTAVYLPLARTISFGVKSTF